MKGQEVKVSRTVLYIFSFSKSFFEGDERAFDLFLEELEQL